MSQNWQEYYQQTKNNPPSSLLIKAVAFLGNKNTALDLGSGALKDSKYLNTQGFKKIVAVDKNNPPAQLLKELPESKFIFIQLAFNEYNFPVQTFNLINAQYSLPFNDIETFEKVWAGIKDSLAPEGIFVGQFFGVNDEWNKAKSLMSFHTKNEVYNLLNGFNILEFNEEEKDGKLANGQPKHWHVFHVIAKKN